MKKLFVIGAGFLQDFVISKAVSMGYETLAVDADPHAIGFSHAHRHAVIDIVDEKACLDFAKAEQIDGVITAATDYGVVAASYVAQELGLPGLKYDVAKLIKNKYRVRKRLYEANVDDSEQTFEVNSETDIKRLAMKLVYPVMVKPCDGSGSRGASRVDNWSELANACLYAIDGSKTRRAVIEPFLFGKEYGAESLVLEGRPHVLGIMRKKMTFPPYYAELGHMYPSGLSQEMENKAIRCVEKAIYALGISCGSVNMDLIVGDDGDVHIVDVGARMGGNMIGPCVIPYGTGIDYMGAMIANAMNDPADLSARERSAVATRLLAFDGGVVHDFKSIEGIEREFGVQVFHCMYEGMHVNEYRTNLDGCGYIVAIDDSVEEAESKAEMALDRFKRIVF